MIDGTTTTVKRLTAVLAIMKLALLLTEGRELVDDYALVVGVVAFALIPTGWVADRRRRRTES